MIDDVSDAQNPWDLYGDDSALARARADAMAQRARGLQGAGLLIKTLTGDRDPTGGALAQSGQHELDQLAGAAQHVAQLGVQRQHYANDAAWRNAMLGINQQKADTQAAGLGLKRTELTTTKDPLGNVVQRPKYGGLRAAGPAPADGATAAPSAPAPSGAAPKLTGGVDDIVQAIIDGKQPPDLKGLYRAAPAIKAQLARRGFDQSTALSDWNATQKHITSMNSAQQLRLAQAANTANESLGNIEGLYSEWKSLGGASGYPAFNKVALAASKQVPGRLGEVGRALEMNIADLTAELGNVYMGGNSPTEEALKLARQNLSADWNEGQFTEGIKQARKNIGYRLNAIKLSGVAGASAGNKYGPKDAAPSPAAAPAAGPAKADPLGLR